MQEQLANFNEEESALLSSRFESKPAEVGHEEMLEMMSEAVKEESTEVAPGAVEEVQDDITTEASKIVAEFEAMIKESESKTLKMVSDIRAIKAKAGEI
jgi:NADH:ubiquinone oxidoreductase subunit E